MDPPEGKQREQPVPVDLLHDFGAREPSFTWPTPAGFRKESRAYEQFRDSAGLGSASASRFFLAAPSNAY